MQEKVKILLVSNDENLEKDLIPVLQENNYIIENADSGEKALKKVNEQFFNIIITEYRLIDMDGLTLGKNIKELAFDTEIIIITSKATLASAIMAVKENIYEYLTKPVNPYELIDIINGALKKQRLILENNMLLWELKMSNKKLERLNKFKDGLISMISHDLRSPISSFKGFNYALLQERAGKLTKKQKEIIKTENETIDAMIELINNLLDIRQIEAGELKMKKQLCNMNNSAIAPVVKRLMPQMDQKKIELTVNCERNMPEVKIDVGRMAQVVQNLLQNAVKFTPRGGRIEVNLLEADNQQVELQVKDTGKGIPEELLNSIFEVFYTMDDTNIERAKTSRGLGLAICREIIKAHNGLIWAESEGPGKGSTFIVMLPLGESNK